MRQRYLFWVIAWLGVSGCKHATLGGSVVRATKENRAIYALLEQFKAAFEHKNSGEILSLVSEKYYEDMGTADLRDDYGYQQFAQDILPKHLAVTSEAHFTFELHDIVISPDKQDAYADIRYVSRTQLDLPGGKKWDRHKDFNRIEFQKEGAQWKIVSGL